MVLHQKDYIRGTHSWGTHQWHRHITSLYLPEDPSGGTVKGKLSRRHLQSDSLMLTPVCGPQRWISSWIPPRVTSSGGPRQGYHLRETFSVLPHLGPVMEDPSVAPLLGDTSGYPLKKPQWQPLRTTSIGRHKTDPLRGDYGRPTQLEHFRGTQKGEPIGLPLMEHPKWEATR